MRAVMGRVRGAGAQGGAEEHRGSVCPAGRRTDVILSTLDNITHDLPVMLR